MKRFQGCNVLPPYTKGGPSQEAKKGGGKHVEEHWIQNKDCIAGGLEDS